MWLLLLFIGVPAAELWLILEVGGRLGAIPTFAAIVLTGVLGVTLARQEGLAVLERIRRAVAEGRMPDRELVDGLLVLLAGALLLTPGFLTDLVGLFILFPLTRPFVRALAFRLLKDRMRPPRDPNVIDM